MTTINEQNIRSYLERGESQTLEYKSGTSSLDAICKVVASFANAEGGILILGFVEPKGIVGVLPDRIHYRSRYFAFELLTNIYFL